MSWAARMRLCLEGRRNRNKSRSLGLWARNFRAFSIFGTVSHSGTNTQHQIEYPDRVPALSLYNLLLRESCSKGRQVVADAIAWTHSVQHSGGQSCEIQDHCD